MESLEARLELLEQTIGLNHRVVSDDDEATEIDLDVASLKKRIRNLELGFIMDLPIDKLKQIHQIYSEVHKSFPFFWFDTEIGIRFICMLRLQITGRPYISCSKVTSEE